MRFGKQCGRIEMAVLCAPDGVTLDEANRLMKEAAKSAEERRTRAKAGMTATISKQSQPLPHPVLVTDIIDDELDAPFLALMVVPAGYPNTEPRQMLVERPAPPLPKVKVGSQLNLTMVRFGECLAYFVDH
jgi:hypothetical protein